MTKNIGGECPMKMNKLFKLFICGMMSSALIIASGHPTIADENKTLVFNNYKTYEEPADTSRMPLENALEQLVKEGKLTKEKADKILEYSKNKAKELKKLSIEERQQYKQHKGKGFLRQLEEEGVITPEEAREIREKLHELKEARISAALDSLVAKGVLSKDDAANVQSYLVKLRDEKKEEFDKVQKMSDSERKEYFKSRKAERKDVITRMVEDKVITEKQAEELRKALPELGKLR